MASSSPQNVEIAFYKNVPLRPVDVIHTVEIGARTADFFVRPSATLHKSDSCASLGSLLTDLGTDGAVIARESQSTCAIGAGLCSLCV